MNGTFDDTWTGAKTFKEIPDTGVDYPGTTSPHTDCRSLSTPEDTVDDKEQTRVTPYCVRTEGRGIPSARGVGAARRSLSLGGE